MSRISYEIVYKDKKSISISINGEGKVRVSVPYNTRNDVIERVIKSKEGWILKKLQELDKREELGINTVMYLGKKYPIEVMEQPFLKRGFVTIFNGKFIINVNSKTDSLMVLEEYLKKETFKIVKEKVNKYRCLFGSYPKDIKVKKLKSRWGSCTYDNVLTFNSKLIMFRESSIDYVVIHEMCHMIHKNHSKDYWNLVQSVMRNYKDEHKYLRENGHLVNIIIDK